MLPFWRLLCRPRRGSSRLPRTADRPSPAGPEAPGTAHTGQEARPTNGTVGDVTLAHMLKVASPIRVHRLTLPTRPVGTEDGPLWGRTPSSLRLLAGAAGLFPGILDRVTFLLGFRFSLKPSPQGLTSLCAWTVFRTDY